MAQTETSQADPSEVDVERLQRLADLMDSAFSIPGTNIRIGLDSLVGLVPGAGDTLALVPAAYIIGHAWKAGAPKRLIGRMAVNTAIDTAIGSVPLIGDIFDVGFKANRRNVALLRDHLDMKKGRPTGTAQTTA